ncbi:proline-serine-threonine phosphatase-interacting protein 2-like [Oratosquilla oratoria]|uniref:proline-serine-threonine phosphatase-interacting protein 2-like n=1 Tax=Oratosquilla oratoria TaxID=337810 RepID=UPI003F767B31
MGSLGAFVTDFLNSEIGDIAGWEIVSQRVKEGNKVASHYVDFLKQVSLALETLGKTLVKISKTSPLGELETGRMRKCLKVARQGVKGFGQDSMEAAATLTSLAANIHQHVIQARTHRRECEDIIRPHHHHLKESTRKLKSAKKQAKNRMREMVQAEEIYMTLDGKVDVKGKEVEKAASNDRRTKESVENAEAMVKESVVTVNANLATCISTLQASLVSMQEVEEERIRILRDTMWSVANVISFLSVHIDQHMEMLRTVLEKIDVKNEILDWIGKNKTGCILPSSLIYNPTPRPLTLSTPGTTPGDTPRTTPSLSVCSIDEDLEESEKCFEELVSKKCLFPAVALYSFEARSNSEVSLATGEEVEVLDHSSSDWALIRKVKGAMGFVPSVYIKETNYI